MSDSTVPGTVRCATAQAVPGRIPFMDAIMHAEVFTVDGALATLGSADWTERNLWQRATEKATDTVSHWS